MKFNGKIAVLKGGFSDERAISLKTSENVEQALKELGFKYTSIDCKDDFIEKLISSNFDLCFNALHGEFGEDGQIQALLEEIGIKYTHSGISSSILAMNKVFSKEIFIRNNVPTPKYKMLDKEDINENDILIPSVIKPINNGSSVGVYIILSESDKTSFLNDLKNWKYGKYIMVEKYIKGRELTCGIIDNKPTEVMEIKAKNIFYDYETKYTQGMSEYVLANDIPRKTYTKIQDLTMRCHNLLGCKGVTRTDFRLEEGEFLNRYVLELNTNPGLTKTS
jgi:D-alanine--D-alanine ligase